jgi:hypothetical protein
MRGRPTQDEYAPSFETYVKLVPEEDVVAALEIQIDDMMFLLHSISEEDSLVRHPLYAWSTREVVGHMTDAERIFGCRALRFARGDRTPLPGFDENAYARSAGFDRVPLGQLAEELEAARRSNLLLFKSIGEEAWTRGGEANGSYVTVRALAAIMVGHARHHTAILRRRLARR